MNLKTISTILILLFFNLETHAEVFRCKDSKGKTTYSDAPCEGDVSLVDATPFGTEKGIPKSLIGTLILRVNEASALRENWYRERPNRWFDS